MEEIRSPLPATVNESGLLDMLVTLAENAKLLVIGPLLAGLCALGLGFVLPPTYQSVAVLQAEQATASLMTTAAVLDPVAAGLGMDKEEGVEEARRTLRDDIRVTVGRNDKLLTLTVLGRTPEQAQATAQALIQQTYLQSRPKGSVAKRLEVQLAEAQERLKSAQDASVGLLKRLESNSAGVNGGAELARGYAELLNASATAQSQVSALETQLEGLTEALLVQSPTLPQKSSQPKKSLMAIGTLLATGLLLLLFIFVRQVLRTTAADPDAATKLARIRRALGLKPQAAQ
jgi:capsular polysaccharide biosynthesis protein